MVLSEDEHCLARVGESELLPGETFDCARVAAQVADLSGEAKILPAQIFEILLKSIGFLALGNQLEQAAIAEKSPDEQRDERE